MPTDHPRVIFTDVWVPDDADLGRSRAGASASARASCTRTASARRPLSWARRVYCIEGERQIRPRAQAVRQAARDNQAIQFPLVELQTQCEMLRLLIRKTAWEMDQPTGADRQISDKVSMCNYWANRLCCEAADRAMQVHGGIGYSRHKPFEHIYRHHRRYRITEGTEEIQMRKVAAFLFGFIKPSTPSRASPAEPSGRRSADAGHLRPAAPDQVGGGELDLQPAAPAAAAEHRGEAHRGRVEHHRDPLARADRGDPRPHTRWPRSAAVTWAIAAFLPPEAAASALRSS